MTDYDKIKDEVDAKLKDFGITYNARYCGETVKWENQKVDHFRITLGTFETDYCMGLGNRKIPANYANASPETLIRAAGGFGCHGQYHPKSDYDRRMLKQAKEKLAKPTAPRAADVLYSLFSDASAADMSFLDWCSDYGMNSDSIKDLGVYNACCEIGIKMRGIFTHAQREALRELTQEL